MKFRIKTDILQKIKNKKLIQEVREKFKKKKYNEKNNY